MACNDTFKASISWIYHGQNSKLHMSEDVKNFLKLISALAEEGGFLNVRSDVYHLLSIGSTNAFNLFKGSFLRVEVAVEMPVLKFVICQGYVNKVFHACELSKCRCAFQDFHLVFH